MRLQLAKQSEKIYECLAKRCLEAGLPTTPHGSSDARNPSARRSRGLIVSGGSPMSSFVCRSPQDVAGLRRQLAQTARNSLQPALDPGNVDSGVAAVAAGVKQKAGVLEDHRDLQDGPGYSLEADVVLLTKNQTLAPALGTGSAFLTKWSGGDGLGQRLAADGSPGESAQDQTGRPDGIKSESGPGGSRGAHGQPARVSPGPAARHERPAGWPGLDRGPLLPEPDEPPAHVHTDSGLRQGGGQGATRRDSDTVAKESQSAMHMRNAYRLSHLLTSSGSDTDFAEAAGGGAANAAAAAAGRNGVTLFGTGRQSPSPTRIGPRLDRETAWAATLLRGRQLGNPASVLL